MSYDDFEFRPYVSVAQRRRNAEREMKKLQKRGHPIAPVIIDGRTIARTFWGKAWCENLEGYSDYDNRLPRGRTYVRNGSVVDLQLAPGKVAARVSGSEIYEVAVKVAPVPGPRWASIRGDCAGGIDSLVELLQGRFSKGVMERICRRETGLFPSPNEIQFSCSCPDWASLCKHVAAVLYGIGARLDAQPELLFQLRQVDAGELIAEASAGLPLALPMPTTDKVLGIDGLSDLFGLELAIPGDEPRPADAPPSKRRAKKAPRKARPQAKATPEIPRLAVLLKAAARRGAASARRKAPVAAGVKTRKKP